MKKGIMTAVSRGPRVRIAVLPLLKLIPCIFTSPASGLQLHAAYMTNKQKIGNYETGVFSRIAEQIAQGTIGHGLLEQGKANRRFASEGYHHKKKTNVFT